MDPNREFQPLANTDHQIPAQLPSNGSLLSKIIIPLAIVLAGGLIAWAIYASPTSDTSKSDVQNVVAGALQEGAEPEAKYAPINDTDHIRVGDKNAKVILIEYSDTQCPFCKMYHETLQKIAADFNKDNQFAWVYRHFPLDIHKKARKEAEATECAAFVGGKDAFWKYIDLVYKETGSNDKLDPAKLYEFAKTVGIDSKEFTTCLDGGKMTDKVAASYAEALATGARGTPYTILYYKGEYIPLVDEQGRSLGALPYDIMKKIIADLSQNKVKIILVEVTI